MGAFGSYLLESGFAISLFYLFFWVFLKAETHHSWNRIYLIVSIWVSLLIPFFSISLYDRPDVFGKILDPIIVGYKSIRGPKELTTNLNIWTILYVAGCLLFSIRFLVSLTQLYFLYIKFPKKPFHGFKAVILENKQFPFVFFNILFISRIDYELGMKNEMIVHEQAHKDQFHTFDVLLIELVSIMQWFNPFIWMIKYSLKSQHEFIADAWVLNAGFDRANYKKLLCEKSLDITLNELTNHFNFSLLKKRLKMIEIKKSSLIGNIKYCLSIPFLGLVFVLLTLNLPTTNALNSSIETKSSQMAIISKTDEIGLFIQKHLIFPESAIKSKVNVTVFVDVLGDENGSVIDAKINRTQILSYLGQNLFIKSYNSNINKEIEPKTIDDLENEAIRVCKLLPKFYHGEDLQGNRMKALVTLPIKFDCLNFK